MYIYFNIFFTINQFYLKFLKVKNPAIYSIGFYSFIQFLYLWLLLIFFDKIQFHKEPDVLFLKILAVLIIVINYLVLSNVRYNEMDALLKNKKWIYITLIFILFPLFLIYFIKMY